MSATALHRVLITGAFGYIGGHLLRTFPRMIGIGVVAASRMPRVPPPGVHCVLVDWQDCQSIESLCSGVDTIVHVAGVGEKRCAADPEEALTGNTLTTLRLIVAAERAAVRRIIYISTSKVFGPNPAGHITEQSIPRPFNHYAITHRSAEDYVLARHQAKGIEGVVLRLSNSVGAPIEIETAAWDTIANDLCRQAVLSRRIVLKSSGLAWRNFISIADVVGAIAHVLALPVDALGDGLFNVGGLASTRIIDLAQTVADEAEEMLGIKVAVDSKPGGAQETYSKLEWSTAKLAATGWSAKSDVKLEIRRALAFCAKNFAADSSD